MKHEDAEEMATIFKDAILKTALNLRKKQISKPKESRRVNR